MIVRWSGDGQEFSELDICGRETCNLREDDGRQ